MSRQSDTGLDARVAEQAADWVARLDSQDCTAVEREAFERWRAADPVHAVAYRYADNMWRESCAVIRNSLALSDAAKRALRSPPERRSPWRWWLPAASFAMLAFMAIAIYRYWLPGALLPLGTSYATLAGEQRSIALEDGSRLVLDTQTVLVERYGRHQRRVDLQQGQAQFEVRGNPDRPFVVHTSGGTVTAIGTRFQVRIADAGTTVSLLEGKVRVAAGLGKEPEQVVDLQAGQSLHLARDGRLGGIRTADMKAAQGWIEGKLYVDDWPLQDFVTELNRYSDVQLRIEDPTLREVRISGVFQTRNRDKLGLLLAQGWGIQSRQVGSRDVLLTRQ